MGRNAQDHKATELRAFPLFAACSDDELRAVAASFDEVHVDVGRKLCEQGRLSKACYVLLDGSAQVSIGARRLCTVAAGDVVGELSVLDLLPRTATVVTTVPTRALTTSSHVFRGLLASTPPLALSLLDVLSRRVRAFDMAFAAEHDRRSQLVGAGHD